MKVKCLTCGKVLSDTDIIYQVRTFDFGSNEHLYSAACSQECAREAQIKCRTRLESILNSVARQSFQIMTVKQY